MGKLHSVQKKILFDQRYKVDVWLFYGMPGTGKFTVAQSFANWFLDKALSDLFIIDIDIDIGVNLIRDMKAFFSSTSAVGTYKIAIINNAETMTIQGQNALLKILEDKTFNNSIIIIITNNIDIMLNTVVSRCRKMHFSSPSIEEIKLLFPNVRDGVIEFTNHSIDLLNTFIKSGNNMKSIGLDLYISVLKNISNQIGVYHNIDSLNAHRYCDVLKLAISRIIKSYILNIKPLFHEEEMLMRKCMAQNKIEHYLSQYFKIVQYEKEKCEFNLDARYILSLDL